MILFVAPHPDDIPLSCGGMVHHLCATQSAPVVMFTVMSGHAPHPLPSSPFIEELHARWGAGENPVLARRAEDECAGQVLGISQVIHGEIPDAVYRTDADGNALYTHVEAIFSAPHPQDTALARLRAHDLTLASAVSQVYLPLGAGNHVDHQIVREWGLGMARANPLQDVYFYADYPYSRDEQAVAQALTFFGDHLTAHECRLHEQDVVAKLNAIACYHSQISTFWANPDEMRAHVRADMTSSNGQWVERYWHFSPSS